MCLVPCVWTPSECSLGPFGPCRMLSGSVWTPADRSQKPVSGHAVFRGAWKQVSAVLGPLPNALWDLLTPAECYQGAFGPPPIAPKNTFPGTLFFGVPGNGHSGVFGPPSECSLGPFDRTRASGTKAPGTRDRQRETRDQPTSLAPRSLRNPEMWKQTTRQPDALLRSRPCVNSVAYHLYG